MIYNNKNTIDIGKPVKRVVDANGLDWQDCIEVDTETGRIVHAKGYGGALSRSHETGEIVKIEEYGAPPLILIFENPESI